MKIRETFFKVSLQYKQITEDTQQVNQHTRRDNILFLWLCQNKCALSYREGEGGKKEENVYDNMEIKAVQMSQYFRNHLVDRQVFREGKT